MNIQKFKRFGLRYSKGMKLYRNDSIQYEDAVSKGKPTCYYVYIYNVLDGDDVMYKDIEFRIPFLTYAKQELYFIGGKEEYPYVTKHITILIGLNPTLNIGLKFTNN